MQENFEDENLDTRLQKGNEYNALELNSEVADNYLETVKWSKWLSIVGIAICTLMVGIAISAFIFALFDKAKDTGGYVAIIIFFIAIFIGFHSIPTYFLFNASRNLKNGIMEGAAESALKGIRNFKSFFKFATVFTTILLVLLVFASISSLFMQNKFY